jgi:hypothetical protein
MADELDADPDLVAEIASWRYYNFAGEWTSWKSAEELLKQMSAVYHGDPDDDGDLDKDLAAVATEFVKACATAVANADVKKALGEFNRDGRFRINVVHPDSRQEFYSD